MRNIPNSILLCLAGLCVATVVLMLVGAGVRLMGAGLTITSWDPIIGIIPPLSRQAWLLAFEQYQATHQFQLLFPLMSFETFRLLYWWEWVHRFLARCLGVFYVLTLLFHWKILRTYPLIACWLYFAGLLLFLQACMGWWMVKSGLYGENTFVEPALLGLHLLMALLLLGCFFWIWRLCSHLVEGRIERGKKPLLSMILLCMLFLIQVFLGALNAGQSHRFHYGSWDIFWQYSLLGCHFLLAFILLGSMIFQWCIHARDSLSVVPIYVGLCLFLLQIGLGLSMVLIPWGETFLTFFSWIHQAIAISLWLCLLWIVDIYQYPLKKKHCHVDKYGKKDVA